MFEKLKAKLSQEGRTFMWFVRNYLPEIRYPAVMSQLHDINTMKDDVKEAIEKYLNDK